MRGSGLSLDSPGEREGAAPGPSSQTPRRASGCHFWLGHTCVHTHIHIHTHRGSHLGPGRVPVLPRTPVKLPHCLVPKLSPAAVAKSEGLQFCGFWFPEFTHTHTARCRHPLTSQSRACRALRPGHDACVEGSTHACSPSSERSAQRCPAPAADGARLQPLSPHTRASLVPTDHHPRLCSVDAQGRCAE